MVACDGAEISGDLLMPEGVDNPPIAILVHDVGENHNVWDPAARALQAEGIGSFAIDLRGHGSSQRINGEAMVRSQFDEDAWLASHRDVIRAGEILADRFPGSRATVVGRRFGASLSSMSVRHMRNVQGVIFIGAAAQYNATPLLVGRRQRGKAVLVVPLGSSASLDTARQELPDLIVHPTTVSASTVAGMIADEALWSAMLQVIRAPS